VFNPAVLKKARIFHVTTFGVANFLAPPVHIVGSIVRKRARDEASTDTKENGSKVEIKIENAIEGERNPRAKRACKSAPWQKECKDEEARFDAFMPQNTKLPTEWDGEEEL
jgi:hypothetical protein